MESTLYSDSGGKWAERQGDKLTSESGAGSLTCFLQNEAFLSGLQDYHLLLKHFSPFKNQKPNKTKVTVLGSSFPKTVLALSLD